MRKTWFLMIALFGSMNSKVSGADLVVVINTLECANYYRSAPLLTDLKQNFDIKFIFPEYESRIAIKYLDEKFNLKWGQYQVEFNDSLYNMYRKNMTSECVYFPDNSKNPLVSFPFSQLAMSFHILKSIPSKIKIDTIPVDPHFLFTGDMSFSFDSIYLYILDAQFGSVLQLNKQNYEQKVMSLPDTFQYENVMKFVLTPEEIKNSGVIESQLVDQKSFIRKNVNFQHITCNRNLLLIRASIEYYKKSETDKIGIYTRNFIIEVDPFNFSQKELIPLPNQKDFYYSYAPVFANKDTLYLPIGIQPSIHLDPDKKYLIAKYIYINKNLKFIGFNKHNCLPEEHTRLGLNYNFLNYSAYNNYFSFPFTKNIYNTEDSKITIKLLPDVDTLPGSKIPEIKTNYMKLSFSVEYPIVNFIAKFDDGKVKLFSYDYSNNLPFNNIELPVKIKTLWPEEDFFKFISINSFIHINLRNQYIVKYYW